MFKDGFRERIRGGGRMRQHITVEQMKGVKDKVLAKYMDLRFTHLLEAVCYYSDDIIKVNRHLKEMSKMVTIGKMIEIIYKYDDVEIQSSGKQWYIGVAGHIETQAEELVDALWEAVKIILEY